MKYRILDLCCRGGSCSKGYVDAGFDVVGVDIEPQKSYPYEFYQADAFDFASKYYRDFDAIHASPHCQGYMPRGKHMKSSNGSEKPQQIHLFREMLLGFDKPYIIENIMTSPIADLPLFGTYAIILCGTMFGLKTPCGAELQRHRLFETNWYCHLPFKCNHNSSSVVGVYDGYARDRRRVISVFGHHYTDTNACSRNRRRTITVTGNTPESNVERNKIRETFSVQDARIAMGIDWMTMKDLSQAIPLSYTEFIGKQLIQYLEVHN
jgi:DNA (cytosine-5)-methyltransferase 1